MSCFDCCRKWRLLSRRKNSDGQWCFIFFYKTPFCCNQFSISLLLLEFTVSPLPTSALLPSTLSFLSHKIRKNSRFTLRHRTIHHIPVTGWCNRHLLNGEITTAFSPMERQISYDNPNPKVWVLPTCHAAGIYFSASAVSISVFPALHAWPTFSVAT